MAKKKVAPKKVAPKKAVKKTAPKKVLKKAAAKAPVKKEKRKAVTKKTEESVSAKNADQVVVGILKAKHAEARQTAVIIIREMGPRFFTIADMVKKGREGNLVIYKNTAHPGLPQKLSWNDAKNMITTMYSFGLIELHPETKDCVKIRLDKEFRIAFFQNQKQILVTKMSDANISIDMIKAEEEYKADPVLEVVK